MAQPFKSMRVDLPSPTERCWTCAVCDTHIHAESQEVFDTKTKTVKIVYTPVSRYWNGYGEEVYCSVYCGKLDWSLS